MRRLLRPFFWFLLSFSLATKVVEWSTEAWFFQQLGYTSVFQKSMLARSALFVGGAAWCACLLWLNLQQAARVIAQQKIEPVQRLIPLEDKRAIDRYKNLWVGVLFFLIIILSGSYAATHWMVAWRALSFEPTGQSDPVLGRNIAFYLFQLPALNFIWTYVWGTLWLTLLVVALFYIYEDIWQTRARLSTISLAATRHLTILSIALLVWKALGYRLSAWNMITARGEPLGGFGYTALHFRLPLLVILATGATLTAWALWRGIRLNTTDKGASEAMRRVLLIWAGANLCIGTGSPLFFEVLYVRPRRQALEEPLFKERQRATRQAFALNNVLPWDARPEKVSTFTQVVSTIPLWTPELVQAYLQKHHRRGEGFVIGTPRFDCYQINGLWRAVWVAPREAFSNRFGCDLIFCDASRISPDGQPVVYEARFFPALRAQQPTIIFGTGQNELRPDNARQATGGLVDVLRPYREGENAAPYMLLPSPNFESGIALNTLWRRALLAWRFGDSQILQANNQRLLWHRSVIERCQQIAPFLIYGEPHPVLHEGRIQWLIPAHTVADSYPLAFAVSNSKINYLRASVMAWVDAYNGVVQFVALDESDRLLQAYRCLFPELFHDFSQMPGNLRAHIPLSLLQFTAQSDLWARTILPSPEDYFQGKPAKPTALRQPVPWNNIQTVTLAASPSLLPNGQIRWLKLFSQEDQVPEKSLSTPVTGALAGGMVNGHAQLHSWQAKTSVILPQLSRNEPLTVNVALDGNELLWHGLRFPKQQTPQPFWFTSKAGLQTSSVALLAAKHSSPEEQKTNKIGTPPVPGR